MNGWQIGLVAYFALCAFVSVATIGKARKPLEPLGVAISLIIYVGLIYVVWAVR